jgi:universal stress protein E
MRGRTGSVKKLGTILVVVDPFDASQNVLAKSMVLARHLGAKLELFLCDSEQAYALKHTYDQQSVEQARQGCLVNARRYLESLRGTVLAGDVPISMDVACESPLYDGVVHKVLRCAPDLVIKSVARARTGGQCNLGANEWELARACPVPLMLTRSRPWRAQSHFAASVDVSADQADGRAGAIMQAAELMARCCDAKLDAIYSEPDAADVLGGKLRVTALHTLGTEFGIAADGLHVLSGDPEITLAGFVAERGYDMVVLGALAHHLAQASLVGKLTSKLVDVLDCDILLIRSGNFSAPA